MKSILVLLAFVGLALAFSEKEYQDAFVGWMQKFDTAYPANDFSAKFAAFKANMDFVQSWNQAGNSHEVELNQFADLTNEEYQRIYLGTHIVVDDSAPVAFELPNPLAADVDWRTKGYVTPIKDQGQCGSCWSFSAAGSTEGAHFKATGNLVSLSEQNLMDCAGAAYGNAGCNGGLMDGAFRYIIKNNGIDTEASYPYKAANEACHYSAANSGATLKSYTNVAAKSEAALQSALQSVGPISVAIDASHQSFQLYKSGVYYEAACSATRLDHGVLAVGYGTDAGEDYYIVKNSWGTKWGMAGYINMARGKNNNCGIASEASYPVA